MRERGSDGYSCLGVGRRVECGTSQRVEILGDDIGAVEDHRIIWQRFGFGFGIGSRFGALCALVRLLGIRTHARCHLGGDTVRLPGNRRGVLAEDSGILQTASQIGSSRRRVAVVAVEVRAYRCRMIQLVVAVSDSNGTESKVEIVCYRLVVGDERSVVGLVIRVSAIRPVDRQDDLCVGIRAVGADIRNPGLHIAVESREVGAWQRRLLLEDNMCPRCSCYHRLGIRSQGIIVVVVSECLAEIGVLGPSCIFAHGIAHGVEHRVLVVVIDQAVVDREHHRLCVFSGVAVGDCQIVVARLGYRELDTVIALESFAYVVVEEEGQADRSALGHREGIIEVADLVYDHRCGIGLAGPGSKRFAWRTPGVEIKGRPVGLVNDVEVIGLQRLRQILAGVPGVVIVVLAGIPGEVSRLIGTVIGEDTVGVIAILSGDLIDVASVDFLLEFVHFGSRPCSSLSRPSPEVHPWGSPLRIVDEIDRYLFAFLRRYVGAPGSLRAVLCEGLDVVLFRIDSDVTCCVPSGRLGGLGTLEADSGVGSGRDREGIVFPFLQIADHGSDVVQDSALHGIGVGPPGDCTGVEIDSLRAVKRAGSPSGGC